MSKSNLLKDHSATKIVTSIFDRIRRLTPAHINPERLARTLVTQVEVNEALGECTAESFRGACLLVAQTGLMPGPLDLVNLIPRGKKVGNNQWIKEVSFNISYKGYLELCRRSGEVATIYANVVHEGDAFDYQYGTEGFLQHRPNLEDPGESKYYYFYLLYKSGGTLYHVMSKKQIEKYAKDKSDNYDSKYSPWATDFDAMALKTVFKFKRAWLPLSTEQNEAVAYDEGVAGPDQAAPKKLTPEDDDKKEKPQDKKTAGSLAVELDRLGAAKFGDDWPGKKKEIITKLTKGEAAYISLLSDQEIQAVINTVKSM